MTLRKKISHSDDLNISCSGAFSESDHVLRHKEYPLLPDVEFQKKYHHLVYTPAQIVIDGVTHKLQFNFCNNIFCKWFGQPQLRYENIKSKPSRYTLQHAGERIRCNCIPNDLSYGVVLENESETLSNWSAAEEIKRLIAINSTTPITKDYVFHRDGCTSNSETPFNNKKAFYTRGESTSGSAKYQCKECKKLTNVLPTQRESFNYHQQRNDILIRFADLVVQHSPVKRTCDYLKIGSQTYYDKLEWLYGKCLEFLERHEVKPLKEHHFKELWLNTDALVYHLKNIRQKGAAKHPGEYLKDKKLPTYIIASGDIKSGYVFRSDIAYDYSITLDDVERDTQLYHCDHTYSFLRRNERLRYSYLPKPPTGLDKQTQSEYQAELHAFNLRKKYVEGVHVKTTYTAIAQYWLLRETLDVKEWFFISDDDQTLQSAIFRVFKDDFLSGYASYFVCQTNKSLSRPLAKIEHFKAKHELRDWAESNGLDRETDLDKVAVKKLEEDLKSHNFYNYKHHDGQTYPIEGTNPIKHPSPYKAEGNRFIKPISDLTNLTPNELAPLILQVTSRTVNNFFQLLRRRINTLERPMLGGRAEGKSYIYNNCNPKYAQFQTTIMRTYYNFCWVPKKGEKITPAQRLGITDKRFSIRDIVYFS